MYTFLGPHKSYLCMVIPFLGVRNVRFDSFFMCAFLLFLGGPKSLIWPFYIGHSWPSEEFDSSYFLGVPILLTFLYCIFLHLAVWYWPFLCSNFFEFWLLIKVKKVQANLLDLNQDVLWPSRLPFLT